MKQQSGWMKQCLYVAIVCCGFVTAQAAHYGTDRENSVTKEWDRRAPGAAEESLSHRRKTLLLKRKLIQLQGRIEQESESSEGFLKDTARVITDVMRLCEELGVDTAGIDWKDLQEGVAQGRAGSSICPGLCSKISQILVKVCDIDENLVSDERCVLPIEDADLPFTTVIGNSYEVVEPLAHSAGGTAITIVEGVTVDMCGHQLSVDTSTTAFEFTGAQGTLRNGNILTDGTAIAVDLSAAAASQGIIENISVHVTGSTTDAIVADAQEVWMRDISVRLDAGATGRCILAEQTTLIDGFFLSVLNTGGTLAALETTTTGELLGGVTMRRGEVEYLRTGATAEAIHIRNAIGGESPDAFAEDILIRTSGMSRGVFVEGTGGSTEASEVTLRRLDILSDAVTGIGISIDGARVAIWDCVITSYLEGIHWESAIGYARGNTTFECLTGYSILTAPVIMECNAAINSDTAGFSISTASGRDVILRDNRSVRDSSGGAAGTGFVVAAASTDVTLINNTATGHATGISDAGATTVLIANNKAVGNTADYAGVINTFSAAALTTQAFWHNATP